MHFITVREAPDIPPGFNFCSGIVVHRTDTLSVVLFSWINSIMAINSWVSNSQQRWTGWQTCVTNSDLALINLQNVKFENYDNRFIIYGYTNANHDGFRVDINFNDKAIRAIRLSNNTLMPDTEINITPSKLND